MIDDEKLFSDKEALMIQDVTGETVITFLEVDTGGATLAIHTCDGMLFMMMPSQVKAIKKKLEDIISKERLQ